MPAAPWCGDTARCHPGPELPPLCSFLETLGTGVHPRALATQQRLARPAALAHGMDGSCSRGWLFVLLTSRQQFVFGEQIFTSLPEFCFFFFFSPSPRVEQTGPTGLRGQRSPSHHGLAGSPPPVGSTPTLCFEHQACFYI